MERSMPLSRWAVRGPADLVDVPKKAAIIEAENGNEAVNLFKVK